MKSGKRKGAALFLAVCLMISSLGTGNLYVRAADTPKGWNINIYMCGSNLESGYGLASMDLLEILDAKNVPSDVSITVETGGSSCWYFEELIREYYREKLHMTEETIQTIHPANISNQYIQRYQVKYDNYVQQKGEWIRYPSLELISEKEGVNDPKTAQSDGEKAVSMGDAAIFGDFVQDTCDQENYNVLILWNHGGGTEYGVCADELSGDSLLLQEMEQGLQNGMAGLKEKKLDLVGFDACLMASFETLAVTSRYADYAVASLNNSSGYGWNYTPVIEKLADSLNQEKSYSPRELAVSVVDANIEFYLTDPDSVSYYPEMNVGAYNLTQMDRLVTEFDRLARTLVHLTAADTMRDGIMQAADKALKLGEGMDLVGMYSFLTNTIQYAQDYYEKNKNSSNLAVQENVINCTEYVRQALVFEKALYEGDFFLKQCTGVQDNPYYMERGIGLYYPVNDTADLMGFAKWGYDELGISNYYSAFVYNVFRKINEKQAVTPKTTLTWNGKKGKYVLKLTNTDAKYMAYIRQLAFLKVNGKKLRVRSITGTVVGNTMESAPVLNYYTFQGKPVYVGPKDSSTGEYFLTMDINGGGMQKLYFEVVDGEYRTCDGLQPGDVITPVQWDENDESTVAKSLAYTIQESDVAEDGSVRLPMGKAIGKSADFTYDFLVGNYFGEEAHQWVSHSDTLTFVKAKGTLLKKSYKATGKAICPAVTVKSGTKTLKKGKDYKVTYSNNVAAGKATVTITGLGKYKYAPTKVLTFTIQVNR